MNDQDLNQNKQRNSGSNSDRETGDNNGVQATGANQDKEAQRKGGQHSHSGSNQGSEDSDEESGSSRSGSQSGSNRSGSSASGTGSGSNRNATGQSGDESGGDRSRSGSNQPRGAAVDKDDQRKGGQHTHGGQGGGSR